MAENALRILVVEDDYLTAQRLAEEIQAHGDVVLGPFADVDDALDQVDKAQAAILDVRVQDDNCFLLADSLAQGEVPFVFLTGYDRCVIPPRFADHRVYAKPSCAEPLLDTLHRQHRERIRPDDDSIEAVVLDMIEEARQVMPDEPSVERLVEAVLVRAIEEGCEDPVPPDMRDWLFHLLAVEYLERGRTHLN